MATETDEETDLDEEVARKKAQNAEEYLSSQLDQEDAGDDTGDLEEEGTPKQAAALSSGPKRKTPNYVLTPVDVPKEAPIDVPKEAPPPEEKPKDATLEPRYPTIAEDQPGPVSVAQKAFTPLPYDTSVDLFGENEKKYTTDPETGTRMLSIPIPERKSRVRSWLLKQTNKLSSLAT